MADIPTVRTRRITRDKLAKVFKDHELVKAFENLQQDVEETLPEAVANSTTDADTMLATITFLPRAPQYHPPEDQAARILATQIFGA